MRLTVTTTLPSRKDDQNMWLIVEVDAETMDDLYDEVAETAQLIGQRVFTKRGHDGKQYVEDRTEIIIGVMGIATIVPCHIDYEEQPAYA